MRNLLSGLFIFTLILGSFAFRYADAPEATNKVKWYTWEEAVAANSKVKKKIFVDIYTSWCGWCKRMDKTTFNDPVVAAYLDKHYYAVKFDAEQKEDILFKGHTFAYKALQRRGYHELAAALLDNKLSYPTTVFLTEDFKIDQRLPGYLDADKMLAVLTYIAEEKNKENPMPWKEYEQKFDRSLMNTNTINNKVKKASPRPKTTSGSSSNNS